MRVVRMKEGVSRAALTRRREEVLRLLAAFGLSHSPRRPSRVTNFRDHETGRSRRLRAALESLGPIFSSFGLYMATRVDLLPEVDRSELAAIADRAVALPPATISALITRELGRPPLDIFHAFEERPFASRLLSQTHRAQLPGGQCVTVKLLRPALRDCLPCDAELLPLLKVAFAGRVVNDDAFDDAIDNFRLILRRQADLLAEVGSLETLARDAGDFTTTIRVAPLHRALCTTCVLTIEQPPGLKLYELLSPSRGTEGAAEVAAGGEGIDRGQLARRLCAAWLGQAILGSLFPVGLSTEDVSVMPGGQLVLTGGDFDAMPAESRTNLWGYLVAAASDDTKTACSYLIKELSSSDDAPDSEELWKRFRQAVPFRDGGWGDGDSLAGQLSAHWKLTAECGYLSRPALPSFYRGLFMVAGLAHRLSPERDVLMDALQDVRLTAGMERLRAMISPDQLGDQLSRYALLAVDFPQRLDEVLTLAAEGDAGVRLKMPETTGRRSRENSSAKVAALLLVLAAFVLWARHPASSLAGAWGDSVKAFIFIALGALVLRTASRS